MRNRTIPIGFFCFALSFLFTNQMAYAQQDCEIWCAVTQTFINVCSDCDNVIAADDCADAAKPFICELDGFATTTCAFTADGPGLLPGFCGNNTIVHNNIWIGFTPAFNGLLHLNIEIINCLSPLANCNGIQAAVCRALCANPNNTFFGFEYETLDCVNCVANTFDLITNDAIAGVPHYIMIDGCCGDACEIVINVIEGLPDPGWQLQPITGNLCPSVLYPDCGSPQSTASVIAIPNADVTDPNAELIFTWYDTDGNVMAETTGLSNGTSQSSTLFGINPNTGLPYFCKEGEYTVTVKDFTTCCEDESSAPFEFVQPPGAVAAFISSDASTFNCENEVITMTGAPDNSSIQVQFERWDKIRDWNDSPVSTRQMPQTAPYNGTTDELTIFLEDSPSGAGVYMYQYIEADAFCISEGLICVPADTIKPVIDIEEPAVLDCGTNPTVVLDATESRIEISTFLDCEVGDIQIGQYPQEVIIPTDNYFVEWISDDGHSIVDVNTLTPTITNTGWYTCRITNLENKCESEARVFVDGNVDPPLVELPEEVILDCNNNFTASIEGSHTNATNATYTWEDEDGNVVETGTTFNPTSAGTYTLTVINDDNLCLAKAAVSVTVNDPQMNFEAIPTGVLTCTINSTDFIPVLNGGNAELTYEWTDEDGNVVANSLEYTATAAGDYTLTVTDVLSGCTQSVEATAEVNGDLPTIEPISEVVLNCLNDFTNAVFATASGGDNLSFEWFDENDVSIASGSDITFFNDGDYSLVVLNTDNGCSSTLEVDVVLDNAEPEVEAGDPLLLNCTNDFMLSTTGIASASSNNLSYEWLDPNGNVVSSTSDLEATMVGSYTLQVTNNDNGCQSSDDLIIEINDTPPNPDPGEPQLLNCENEMNISLDGSQSSGQGTLDFEWLDPNGQSIGTTAIVDATVAGVYTLIITDAENGCTNETTIEINEDLSPPEGLLASGGLLSCSAESVSLEGSSTTANVSYTWMSPGGVVYNGQNVEVNEPGTYTLVVTNLDNGCTEEITTDVDNDDSVPSIDFGFINGDGLLNCNTSFNEIEGLTEDGITLQWFDPSGNEVSGNPIMVSDSGTYTVIVTNPVNDCDNMTSVNITADFEEPQIETTTGTILCEPANEVQISANAAGGINYEWTGPNTFVNNSENPLVTEAGEYTVIVTGENGCTSSETLTVDINQEAPEINAAPDFTLTCVEETYDLLGTADVVNATYLWSGPNGFNASDASPTINEAGVYNLTVVNTDNNCESTLSVNIDLDQELPSIETTNAELSCILNMVSIEGNSDGINATYEWTGPNGFSSNMQNPTIVQDGTYILIVTAENGCSSTSTSLVTLNDETPIVNAGDAEDLTCANDFLISLNGSAQVAGNNMSFEWLDPNGNSIGNQVSAEAIIAGTYTFVVTNEENGCTESDEVIVNINDESPSADAGDPQVLNCTNNQLVDLNASASQGQGSLTYEWIDANGNSISSSATTEANSPGIYTVIITDESNGCTEEATVVVTENLNPPEGLIAQGGMLSCTIEEITLMGGASDDNVSYEWLSPGGVPILGQNVEVEEPGSYTLIVTNLDNGCTAEINADVTSDDSVPPVEFGFINGTSNNLNCLLDFTELEGITDVGVDLQWFGPDGSMINGNPIMVSDSGTYTIVVVNPINECDNTTSIQVNADFDEPIFTSAGGTILCAPEDVVEILADGESSLLFEWTGPGGFSSSEISSSVDQPGIYEVIATGSNGCTSIQTVEVFIDQEDPEINAAEPFELTCIETTYDLNASSEIDNAIFLWSGPNGYESDLANPLIEEAGTYNLFVTNPANNCSSTLSIEITASQDFPLAEALGGTISCLEPNLFLSANTDDSTASFEWIGPGGFSSTDQNPEIDLEGEYTLTVLSENGCSQTATAMVLADFEEPNVMALGGVITCTESSVIINGSSSDDDVSFMWSGPNNFSSSDQNPSVTDAGDYTLTVMGLNGCTSSMDILVETDENLPDAATVVSDDLDCNISMVNIEGSSTVSGASFEWSFPNGNTSTDQNIQVEEPGQYILTVTAPNGCPNQTTATVVLNNTPPDIETFDGLIDCVNFSTNLTADSQTPDALYQWTGPNGFTSNELSPSVDVGGIYTLSLTDPSNGCTNQMDLEIVVNQDNPDLSTSFTDANTLDCNNPELGIEGASTTDGVSFNWDGPNGFNSIEATTIINEAGVYTLTVVSPNGCISTNDVIVDADFEIPELTTIGNLITCEITEVDIQANSSDDVSFQWTGPGGFISNESNPTVAEAGLYTVVVTSLQNGCTNISEAIVDVDQGIPIATTKGETITCNDPMVPLSGEGSTTGGEVTYEWFFNNTSISTELNTMVGEAGVYTLIVTDNSNNCTAQSSYEIEEDILPPNVDAGADQVLRCIDEFVTLDGSNTIGQGTLIYEWENENGTIVGTEVNIQTDQTGTFILTVIDDANGCSATSSVVVEPDENAPEIILAPVNVITCEEENTLLDASATNGQGILQFTWTDQNGAVVGNTASVPVSVAGLYALSVIDASNGCESFSSIEILVDQELPVLTIQDPGPIDCINETVALDLDNNATNPQFSWTGPNGFVSNAEDLTDLVFAGIYNVVVTDLNNGCSEESQIEIIDNTLIPLASANALDVLDCVTEEVEIDGGLSSNGLNYIWDGPMILEGQNTLNPIVGEAGLYTLTITDLSNGCTNITSVEVEINDTVIEGMEYSADPANCFGPNTGSISVGNILSGTEPFLFSLDGGDSFSSQIEFNNLSPGSYVILIEDGLGCTWEEEVLVDPALSLQLDLSSNDDDNKIQFGDSINLIPQTNFDVDQFTWNDSSIVNYSPWVTPLNTTTYSVITYDENGCPIEEFITIFVEKTRPVYIPSVFSPNGDGTNDVFMIFANDNIIAEVKSFAIYDRWGEKLFYDESFRPNLEAHGWDGIHRTKNMQPGVYVYYALIEFIDGEVLHFEGDLTLMR